MFAPQLYAYSRLDQVVLPLRVAVVFGAFMLQGIGASIVSMLISVNIEVCKSLILSLVYSHVL